MNQAALQNGPKVVRDPFLAEKVVFVDGLPGCGKTMLSPIVGSLPRVQLLQYSYPIEYICSLNHLGKMDLDAASVFVKMWTDVQLYNVMMSRETNFRPGDISSVFSNARPHVYLKRLFQKGDAKAVERIEEERPILHLATHYVLPFAEPIFEGLGDRALIIEVVRHPAYMIKQQFLYQDRFGKDVRDFTIWFDYKGQTLPYFAVGWEETFLQASAMEKSIYMIEKLWKRVEEKNSGNILEIPFENFVLTPHPYMEKMEQMLGTKSDRTTHKMMKKQKVPRKKIADGRNLSIYKQYGWKPGERGKNEKDEINERRAFAAKHASGEAMQIFDRLCEAYEEKHSRGFKS